MKELDTTVLTQCKDGATQTLVRALVGHATDTRNGRPEDFFGSVTPGGHAADAKGILLAIADGASGGVGRTAAEAIVYSVLTDFYATPPQIGPTSALGSVIATTNRWLYANNNAAGEDGGMLTTLSVLLLSAGRYYVAHVGDTRVYLYRRGRMSRLTADHVWQGKLGHRLLRRAVGLDARIIVDFVDEELAQGDLFLMLTDGAWEALNEPEIADYLASYDDPQRTAEALVERAILRSGHMEPNDATAAVVRVEAAMS